MYPKFSKGDYVSILAGQFTGCSGEIEDFEVKRGRVYYHVDLGNIIVKVEEIELERL